MHKTMKRYRIVIAILIMLVPSLVSAQNELNRYLETAGASNPELKMKFNEYMAALQVAPQVKALPDPQVAFGYFIEPVETRNGPMNFKFSASQMFPWFGTLKAKENSAVEMAKAKYEAFKESKSKLYNEVKNTYFNLYFNDKAIRITLENLDILTIFQKLAIIKVEAGLVSSVDEYRIEMEINDLENQLALLKDKELVLKTSFNNLLNVDESSPIVIPDSLWTDDFPLEKQAALDSISVLNHQLLGIDFQQESLRFKEEAASLMGKPQFKLGLDYTIVGRGDSNMSGKDAFVFPTVGITIPLYRNKYKAMVQEVVYLESAKANERINKNNMLETIFENSWKDYRDAKRRITLFHNQLDLARKALNLLETDYSTGNKNFEEILRMERKVLKYNLELEKSKADKQAAISFINYLMGK